MKKKQGFTLVELIAVIIILAIISLLSFIAITKSIKNNEIKQRETFNNALINAAEIYITSEKDKFTNFENVGDVTMVSVSEMIDDGYINKSIDNPTGDELTDFYVKATIGKDKKIKYEVVG